MKRSGIFLLLLALNLAAFSQTKSLDSTALLILERMSSVITELNSCRLKAHSSYDEYVSGLGLIKHNEDADLLMKGPNKLYLSINGLRGQRTFFYNGKTLSYYSFSNNRYAQIPAPKTIHGMADSIYSKFGVDLTAIDFFFPDFIDVLKQNSSFLTMLGQVNLNGRPCFQIAGAMDSISYQIWVTNDPFFLPVKAALVYTAKEMNPQFMVDYEWDLNQIYPDAIFEFTAPPGALRINPVASEQ